MLQLSRLSLTPDVVTLVGEIVLVFLFELSSLSLGVLSTFAFSFSLLVEKLRLSAIYFVVKGFILFYTVILATLSILPI